MKKKIQKKMEETSKIELDRFRVGTTPTVYYIPNFISEEEEKSLLENVNRNQNLKGNS